MQERKCLNCKTIFKDKPSSPKKFCSRSCAAIINNSQRAESSRHKQRETLMDTLQTKGLQSNPKRNEYYKQSSFSFDPKDFPMIPGYDLFLSMGMWHPVRNPGGVVRDHILSRLDGWLQSIPADIIKHPANCQYISNTENCSKGCKSHLTLSELMNRIQSNSFTLVKNTPNTTSELERRKAISKANLGSRVCNNGAISRRLKANEPLPEGFVHGQIPRRESNSHIQT